VKTHRPTLRARYDDINVICVLYQGTRLVVDKRLYAEINVYFYMVTTVIFRFSVFLKWENQDKRWITADNISHRRSYTVIPTTFPSVIDVIKFVDIINNYCFPRVRVIWQDDLKYYDNIIVCKAIIAYTHQYYIIIICIRWIVASARSSPYCNTCSN